MNILNITINSSTLAIALVILIIMAIIGYYADKTKYSKDYKKNQDKKNQKKFDLSNDARLSDLVGEKKVNSKNTETTNLEVNKESKENIQDEHLNLETPAENVPKELFEPIAVNGATETVKFDEPVNNQTTEKVTFDEPANNQTTETVKFDEPVNNQVTETVTFDEPVNNQVTETVTFDEPVNNQVTETVTFDEPTNNQVTETVTFDEPTNNQAVESVAFDESTNSESSENNIIEESVNNSEEAQELPSNEFSEKENNSLFEETNVETSENIADNSSISTDEQTLNSSTRFTNETLSNEEEKNDAEQPINDYYELDEDLEKKLKEDIMKSIKSVEEEEMENTLELDSLIQEVEDDSSEKAEIKSTDVPKTSSMNLDDDLGVIELPKIKTDKEQSDDDKLSVDDIFNI